MKEMKKTATVLDTVIENQYTDVENENEIDEESSSESEGNDNLWGKKIF